MWILSRTAINQQKTFQPLNHSYIKDRKFVIRFGTQFGETLDIHVYGLWGPSK